LFLCGIVTEIWMRAVESSQRYENRAWEAASSMFESIYRDANGLHIAYSKSNRNIPDVQW